MSRKVAEVHCNGQLIASVYHTQTGSGIEIRLESLSHYNIEKDQETINTVSNKGAKKRKPGDRDFEEWVDIETCEFLDDIGHPEAGSKLDVIVV